MTCAFCIDMCGRCTFVTIVDKKVGLGLGKAIQQARAAKKMTQAQLAQAINEKPAVVNQYENGKAIPNGQVSRMARKNCVAKGIVDSKV